MEKSNAEPASSLLSVADVARILGIKLRRAYSWYTNFPHWECSALGGGFMSTIRISKPSCAGTKPQRLLGK